MKALSIVGNKFGADAVWRLALEALEHPTMKRLELSSSLTERDSDELKQKYVDVIRTL